MGSLIIEKTSNARGSGVWERGADLKPLPPLRNLFLFNTHKGGDIKLGARVSDP